MFTDHLTKLSGLLASSRLASKRRAGNPGFGVREPGLDTQQRFLRTVGERAMPAGLQLTSMRRPARTSLFFAIDSEVYRRNLQRSPTAAASVMPTFSRYPAVRKLLHLVVSRPDVVPPSQS